jgi:hypothetical protein
MFTPNTCLENYNQCSLYKIFPSYFKCFNQFLILCDIFIKVCFINNISTKFDYCSYKDSIIKFER